jgi:hypothetical protein
MKRSKEMLLKKRSIKGHIELVETIPDFISRMCESFEKKEFIGLARGCGKATAFRMASAKNISPPKRRSLIP